MLPTGQRGRLLAVALLLIPLILLINFGVAPLVRSYLSVGQEIESMRDDIARYQRIIGELPTLKASMTRFEQERPLAPFLLPGRNAALAAAGLQRRLQNIAEEHNVRIVSVRVQPAVADGPLQRITVQARLSTDTPGLRNTLYDLEASRPYLFVDNLTITARPVRRRVDADVLEARLSLSGLRAPSPLEAGEASDG